MPRRKTQREEINGEPERVGVRRCRTADWLEELASMGTHEVHDDALHHGIHAAVEVGIGAQADLAVDDAVRAKIALDLAAPRRHRSGHGDPGGARRRSRCALLVCWS